MFALQKLFQILLLKNLLLLQRFFAIWILQPARSHSGQNFGQIYPLFPKSEVSLALINTSGRGQGDLNISPFHHPLVGFVCHLLLTLCSRTEQSCGAQDIQKKGLVCRCWATSAHWLFSPYLILPIWNRRTILISLESRYEWLSLISKQWNVVYRLLGSNLQGPQMTRQWECCHSSVSPEPHVLLCSPVTDFYCSPRSHLSAQPINASCWSHSGEWVHTQRAGTIANALLPQKEKGKEFDRNHGVLARQKHPIKWLYHFSSLCHLSDMKIPLGFIPPELKI